MIPAYIIDKERQNQEVSNQIQLEIPDYSAEYEHWKRQRQRDEQEEVPQTVIVIDIY